MHAHLPTLFSSSTSLRHPWLSFLSLHHHHHHLPHSLPLPASLSFWRVGSSEVVAVCIAKGNVSSVHRQKMGQNITPHCAHAQWLAQCWVDWGGGGLRVLSYPLSCVNVPTSHSCPFSSIIEHTQQLIRMELWSGHGEDRGVLFRLEPYLATPCIIKKDTKMQFTPPPHLLSSICQTTHTQIVYCVCSRLDKKWFWDRKFPAGMSSPFLNSHTPTWPHTLATGALNTNCLPTSISRSHTHTLWTGLGTDADKLCGIQLTSFSNSF